MALTSSDVGYTQAVTRDRWSLKVLWFYTGCSSSICRSLQPSLQHSCWSAASATISCLHKNLAVLSSLSGLSRSAVGGGEIPRASAAWPSKVGAKSPQHHGQTRASNSTTCDHNSLEAGSSRDLSPDLAQVAILFILITFSSAIATLRTLSLEISQRL